MKLSHISEASTPKASTFVPVNYDKLKPGKKSDLKLKLATKLYNDVKSKINVLNAKLIHLKVVKDLPQTATVEGLLDNLKTLESNLKNEIKVLLTPSEITPAVSQLLTKISTDCSEFIAEVKKANQWLYRGSRGTNPSAFVGRSWDARISKDSSEVAQEFFDKYLASQGFVALRSNSIFAISNLTHAKQFGKPYLILPVNGKSAFTYTNRKDLILDSNVPLKTAEISKKLVKWATTAKKNTSYKTRVSLLNDILYKLTYTSNPLWIINIINDPKHKVLKIPAEFTNLTVDDFMSTTAKFNKKFEPSQTDLAKALSSGVEVYVHGVYYALDLSTYGAYLQQFFGVPVKGLM